jgi:hypothetical protein
MVSPIKNVLIAQAIAIRVCIWQVDTPLTKVEGILCSLTELAQLGLPQVA